MGRTVYLAALSLIAYVVVSSLLHFVVFPESAPPADDRPRSGTEVHLGAFHRLLMRLDGMLGPDGSTPREWRLSFWNRRAARSALRKALCWNPERIVIAHGTSVRAGGREALARSMRWLRPDP